MRVTKLVPQEIKEIEIQSIVIDLHQNLVSINYFENGEPKGCSVDVTKEWDIMTKQQKTIIREFLKGIIKKCLSVSDNDIEGEIFQPIKH
jgi:hypothetical protein